MFGADDAKESPVKGHPHSGDVGPSMQQAAVHYREERHGGVANAARSGGDWKEVPDKEDDESVPTRLRASPQRR